MPTLSAITTYAVIAAAIFAAWFFGAGFLHIAIAFAVVVAVIYFVPSVGTTVFGWLGWTTATAMTPVDIYHAALADVESIATELEQAAEHLYDEVATHKTASSVELARASVKTSYADRAKKVASNCKALIA